MKIEVTGCKDCPFKILDYNPEACGYDSLEYCKLVRFITKDGVKFTEDLIRVYDSFDEESYPDITPEWCPLDEVNVVKTNLDS